jgi:hypothetical protein
MKFYDLLGAQVVIHDFIQTFLLEIAILVRLGRVNSSQNTEQKKNTY